MVSFKFFDIGSGVFGQFEDQFIIVVEGLVLVFWDWLVIIDFVVVDF